MPQSPANQGRRNELRSSEESTVIHQNKSSLLLVSKYVFM